MTNLLTGLNEKQKEVVLSDEGPILVLAGAGSGKTKALTHRIAYLMAEKKVRPENILAITFTNKAAGEMKERVEKLISQSAILARPDFDELSQVAGGDHQKSTIKNWQSSMPMMGTFHSVCARILRKDGHSIGISAGFVIYDESDSLAVIKKILKESGYENKKIAPQGVKSYISSAKNELLSPGEYVSLAQGYFQSIVAQVYPKYQKELLENNALDFDDLLLEAVKLFQKTPEVLTKYQNLWTHILIDEYQDTNHAQYMFVKLLAEKNRNICVVGDDWQCFPAGTMVKTARGLKRIEKIQPKEQVLSASGYGETDYFKVERKRKFSYNSDLVEIKTVSGKKIICTPNHVLFSRLDNGDNYYVYLMYSSSKGYRIGTAKGTRFDGRKNDVGLRIRANQERADRMWILRVCQTREEAVCYENLYAYKYGIPMLVFHSYTNRSMALSQKSIDLVYSEINTNARAQELMGDLGIAFAYPHFWPQATMRNGIKRLNINVTLFGDRRKTKASPWSASRISFNTTRRDDMAVFKKLGYAVRRGRDNTYRTEIHNLDYGEIEQLIDKIERGIDVGEVNVCRSAFLMDKKFLFLPASQIHKDMILAVSERGRVVEDRVVSIEKKPFRGTVYDLDVEKVHNYVVQDIIVHNSIYSWRGANFQNILDFEKDYPKAKVIKLEQNYRSTKAILAAAQSVIAGNVNRSKKVLWTENVSGAPIYLYEASSEEDEGGFICRETEKLSGGGLALSDIGIFYRTNAQSRALEEQLLRYQIPYKIVGGVRFYERKEIKDILAWLRIASGANDWISLERATSSPPSGIGGKSIEKIRSFSSEKNSNIPALSDAPELLGVLGEKYSLFKKFLGKIEKIARKSEKSLREGISVAIELSGYKNYLSDGSIQNEERLENLRELLSVAEEYEKLKGNLSLSDFLEEVALVSDIDNYQEDAEGVTLMTLHNSKGLEFKAVFICGLEENIFPHSRSISLPAELEEERRLFYVGLTRAKERLYLICARHRLYFGGIQNNSPSRFLTEIPEHLMMPAGGFRGEDRVATVEDERIPGQIQKGDKVSHENFGNGKVTRVSDDELTVDFPDHGEKVISIYYAPIKKL